MMFLSHSKKEEVVLVIDIGSDSVGGSLSLLSKDQAPKILYSFRSTIVWHEPPEKGHFLIGITKALEHVIKNVAGHSVRVLPHTSFGHLKVHRSHIVFSAPWYVSQTKVFKIEHKQPILVTKNFVDKLFKDEIEKFTNEAQTTANSQIFQNLQVVERRIVSTRLNGYEVSNPFDTKANRVEVTFFVSFVSKDILDATRKVIDTHFHIKHEEISSFPLAAFTAFSGFMPKIQDFLIVDVRGEVTDLSVISNGTLLENTSFPQGKNGLIRTVADGLQQSFHTALSSLKIVLHKNGTSALQESVNKFVESFKLVWLDLYVKTLPSLAVGDNAAKTIFLVGDPDTEIFFENILKEVKNFPSVHPLKKADLKKYVELNSNFNDPFMALETIFVSHLSN